MAEKLNSTKTSFTHIYKQPTPESYYKALTPLGYGEYHDRFARLIDQHEPSVRDGVKKVVDIGCLYGCTSIAYTHGGKWTSTVKPQPITNFEITGVDMSQPALQFGLQAGLYSKVIEQNLNEPHSKDFEAAVNNADALLCMMCLNYFKDDIFAAVLKRFAHTGGKFAVYGTVPMFDDRSYSPEALGLDCKWSESVILRHRKLTSEEMEANGGATESPVRIYIVAF